MPHTLSSFRPLLLALILAVGIAVAWCTAVAWTLGLVQMASQTQQVREDLYVSSEGEPLIVRSDAQARGATQKMFSLDREPLEIDAQQMAYPQYLIGPQYNAARQGVSWQHRLTAANNGGSPAVYWYLVHDGRVNGRAYGVGYHSQSKHVVGYFGKQGFSEQLPPPDEWFQVFGESGLLHVGTLPATSEPTWNQYGETSLVLLAEGKVWIIDVAKRQIEALADSPDALAVGWLRPPQRSNMLGEKLDLRKLLIWQKERVLIVDRDTREQTSLPLPTDFRMTALGTYDLPDHRLLLISFDVYRRDEGYLLTWLDQKGEVTAQRRVQLTQPYGGSEPASMIWGGALAAPFPLASALLAITYPAEQVALGRVESFGGAMADVLRQTWPAFLLVLTVSALLAADAWRRQRQYALPHALAWAAFVFLMGVPGWLAHRFHRVWPALEPCPACRQPAPIDHAACPDCGAVFPVPKLTGIEVFAT